MAALRLSCIMQDPWSSLQHVGSLATASELWQKSPTSEIKNTLTWRIPWTEEPDGLPSIDLKELDATEHSTAHSPSITQELEAPTLCVAENPSVTYSQLSISVVHPHLQVQSTTVFTTEQSPYGSGWGQFKPIQGSTVLFRASICSLVKQE